MCTARLPPSCPVPRLLGGVINNRTFSVWAVVVVLSWNGRAVVIFLETPFGS